VDEERGREEKEGPLRLAPDVKDFLANSQKEVKGFLISSQKEIKEIISNSREREKEKDKEMDKERDKERDKEKVKKDKGKKEKKEKEREGNQKMRIAVRYGPELTYLNLSPDINAFKFRMAIKNLYPNPHEKITVLFLGFWVFGFLGFWVFGFCCLLFPLIYTSTKISYQTPGKLPLPLKTSEDLSLVMGDPSAWIVIESEE
jgi:lipopolysaccharide export LptBFGC system permease protein LptF